jgi:hypothetical protein
LSSNSFAAEKIKIAVLPFEIGASGVPPDAATGIADMLVTALVKTKAYDVVEREQLQKILSEQKFGMSGLVDASTAVQIGKMIGVKKILTGKITQMGLKKASAIFFDISTATVSIDLRMINVETGVVEYAESATGDERLVSLPKDVWGVHAGIQSFDGSVFVDASRKAIDSIIGKMMENIEQLGYVVAVEGNLIIIDLTNADGLQKGQRLQIIKMGKPIIHPATKKVLGQSREIIGNIEIIEVGSDFNNAKIVDAKGEIKEGDRISTKGIKKKKKDEEE